MRATRTLVAVFAALAAATACNAIIGTRDLAYDASADGGGTSSGNPPPGPPGPPPPPGDGGDGGDTCNADLQSDPKNCGRCGRDCLGAKCTMGACEPITLATALAEPDSLALDATNVYVATRYDDKIVRIPKDGSQQPVAIGTPDVKYPRGIAIDGTTLFWADWDYVYDVAMSQLGGIWKCALPACTTPTLVAAINEPQYPSVSGMTILFADTSGAVGKVLPDGGAALVTSGNQVFHIAIDPPYAYFTSSSNDMLRTLIAGDGGTERVGPLNGVAPGDVRTDSDRVYWAFWEMSGKGHVLSVPKASPTTAPIEYQTADEKGSYGVAIDATNLYWADEGTFPMGGGPTNHDGALFSCPKAGCPASGPTVLAKGLADSFAVAVDDAFVYFLEYGDTMTNGTLKKVAKP